MHRRQLNCIALLLLASIVSLLASHQAGMVSRASAGSIDRPRDPVVVSGGSLVGFQGVPVDELFVYAYRDGVWKQIPFQVDEVKAGGGYAAVDNGVVDARDELVFMAKDLGEQASELAPSDNGQPVGSLWFEVQVGDPLDAQAVGWAYVVRSSALSQTFTDRYVSFENNRIVAGTYQLGFTQGQPAFDYLSINGGPDILDRTPKIRACLGTLCITENFPNLFGPLGLVKSGPVRVIVRGSGTALVSEVAAYESVAAWTLKVSAPVPVTRLQLSTDFNENAIGSTYYNSVVPEGVTIDGAPDSVPASPFSPWWQVSTTTGTVVQASDITPAGGEPGNYYVDDSTPCTTSGCDTGDMKHYGDTGVVVSANEANPIKQFFSYRYNTYFLPGSLQNVGSTFQDEFGRSLSVQVKERRLPRVYLPLVFR